MTMNAEELRDEITRSRAGQDHWRCPSALRKKIIEFAEQGRREGRSVTRLAAQVGLSTSPLAAYKRAWADGEPYVWRYELTKTTELLQQMNVPPELPFLGDDILHVRDDPSLTYV